MAKKNVTEFHATCCVCAQQKSSNAPPALFLQPLPVPQCLWSGISIDNVTGPPS